MRSFIYRVSVWLLVVVWLPGCIVSNPGWRTPAGHQRAAARSFWPAEPEVPGAYHARAEVFAVRVYADQAYRQRPHWRDHALGLLRRANAYLGPAFGVSLKPSLIEWERQGGAEDLSVLLNELSELDDGTDADWVIGLTGAPAQFTTSHHHLGLAEMLGKHLVLRDLNDATEARKLDEVFDHLDDDERLALYTARREHKALVVFLHEWGHTVGLVHERGDGRIMFPSYDHAASTFSEADVGVIERGLAIRRVRGSDEAAVAARADATAKLLAYVQATAHDEWWVDERDALIAQLGGAPGGAGGRPAASGGEDGVVVPTGARAGYNRAVDLANAGDVAGAWAELEAVVGAYPDSLPVQRFGCTLAARGEPGAASLKACGRAAVLAPADASVPMLEAEAWERRGKKAEAVAALDRARQRLLAAPAPDARAWYQLAAAYLGLGALTRASEAGERAGERAEDVARMVLERRRLAGLPVEGARVGVPIDAEPAYWDTFWAAYQLFMSEPKLARRTVDEALATYPKAPGLLALACGVDAEIGKLASAKKRCAAALAGNDDTVIAHFFAAQLADDPAVAIRHYEKVVALDPDQRSSWEALGRLYPKVGRRAERDRLATAYQQRFGVPLP